MAEIAANYVLMDRLLVQYGPKATTPAARCVLFWRINQGQESNSGVRAKHIAT